MTNARRNLLLAFASVAALSAGRQALAADAAASPPKGVTDLIVTAPRKTSTARVEQLAAPNIINVQSAEAIAKYPDFNAAESLGRMPGVSLSIDTGEGRFITIRGIDSNLDGATFGGVVLLNSFPGGTYFGGTGRAVEFDTVPVGAVDRIEVTKTGLPDHEAEGIGGSVELTPRSARAIQQPFLDLELSGGFENLRDSWAPINEQVVLGGRFGLGDNGLVIAGHGDPGAPRAGFISNPTPFSFVLTQFQHNDRRSIDDFEEAYGVDNGFTGPDKVYDSGEFRRYNYFRRRFGYSGEFDFDPNADHHYFARVNVAGYTENVNRQRLIYGNLEFDANGNPLQAAGTTCPSAAPCYYTDPNNPSGFQAPAGQVTATLRDQQETHRNTVIAVGGSDRFERFTVDYQGAYTRATYHKPFDFNWTFNNPNTFGINYDNTNSNLPKFTVVSGGNPIDPTQFTLGSLSNSHETDADEEWSGAGNVTVPVHLISDADEFKFGAKIRLRDKTVTYYSERYNISTADTLANFEGGGPYTYYDGAYPIGFRAGGDALKAFYAANVNNPAVFTLKSGSGFQTGSYYHDTENVFAGYAQFKTEYRNVGILAGVRVEGTDATYRGFGSVTDAAGDTVVSPEVNHNSYVDAFPTLQFRYEFMPNLIGRFTYSTGLSRPGFSQTIASTSVDVGSGSVSTGNPKLLPTYSNNIDASLEWYLPGSGILAAGVFDKELSNYAVTRTIDVANYPGIVGIAKESTYLNVPAYARGIEGQYVQKFFWAPEAFRNFGIDSNVTYVDSEIQLFNGVKALLPGTSRWTANASLFYEADGLELRVATEYVGKTLFTVGGSQATNNYEDKRFQVDFSSSYQINRQLKVFFDVKNLNNEPLRFFEGRYDRPLQREFYLQTFEFGVRAHFE
ncbi:TonB-dependent receptor [Phenylobacterium montanum]|uniref:TonB-dependent receptor n=1 Tax=Phenylobacterium montanum TaxID=2823693 RepID=A0A975FZ03_9CAUL|nr:TonB-dependent receptor [Caulobacter sp. S6]QUD87865.1 TonB-dependent receptor [Caulobacter sp. S6]